MKNGTDRGFAFFYWRLSYRRKFIRTIWMIPFAIIAIAMSIIVLPYQITIFMSIGIVVALVAQLFYTYRKWKAEANSLLSDLKP